MGMREKMIELLDAVHRKPLGKEYRERLGTIADALIANGVTIPVRCKECQNRDDITGECRHPKAVGWDVLMPEDDDFCSYGERRTDG